ncbi:ABC transporter permease [Methyloferula stellata]|uniref:ABC transporter permease n=1 Tax=Methyloferula stellata TaxID=876270 RepID=UPI001AEBF6F0|nr:ABC transporter permease [Methyloferula stellata]
MQDDYLISPYGMLKAQWRVLVALMLRDLKTRFFGTEWGFLLAIGWPLSHILILLVINSQLGRAAPYGDSAALWFATGIIPFMAFNYMSRFIMMGILLNKPLLLFPTVKITDILFARAIVEVLSAGLVILIVLVIFWALGIDFMPIDIVQASFALLAMMLLGLGFGVINAIIAAALPFWMTGYALCMIVFWMSSGILFVPEALPAFAREWLAYLPYLQGVEWMRSAYYEGYGASILDKTYLLSWGVATLFTGLALERLVRGRMLQ